MFEFEVVIILITLIVFFSYIAEAIRIPYPIVLMLLGLGIGYLPHVPHFYISRDMLLPLFLPPILFWAAMLTNWYEFRRHCLVITSLGVLLVLITSLLVAFVVNSLFPGFGFMPALLLGAIVSPSDAVCATAVLSRLHLSSRIMSILEGESLINDAGGIVLYNFALSSILFNTSDFSHPVMNFFVVAVGGVIVGGVIGVICGLFSRHLAQKKEMALPVIVSLVLPYLVYYIGTLLNFSSVLAVVAAGMTMRFMTDYKMDACSRLQGIPVWNTLIFILNGLIFIMLGLEFPKIISDTVNLVPLSNLCELTFVVIACIVLVRIVWVYVSGWLLHSAESWKENSLIAWSGMRGIVSLALALSIPTLAEPNILSHQNDILLYATREIILFVAVMTILFTVIVQGLTLPWLVTRLKMHHDTSEQHVKMMRIFAMLTQKTMKQIDQMNLGESEHLQHTKSYMLNYYKNRMQYHQIKLLLSTDKNDAPKKKEMQQAISASYHYERMQLRRFYRQGDIDVEIFFQLTHYLDMEEMKHL